MSDYVVPKSVPQKYKVFWKWEMVDGGWSGWLEKRTSVLSRWEQKSDSKPKFNNWCDTLIFIVSQNREYLSYKTDPADSDYHGSYSRRVF